MSVTVHHAHPEPEPERHVDRHLQDEQDAYALEQQRIHAAHLADSVRQEGRETTEGIAAEITLFYRQRVRSLAEALASEIVSVIRSPFAGRNLSFDNLRRLPIAVADIEENCHLLGQEVRIARANHPEHGRIRCVERARGPIPATRSEHLVEITEGGMSVGPFAIPTRPVPIGEALDSVEPALSDFIQTRAAAGEAEALFARMGMLGGVGGVGGVPSNSYRIAVRSPSSGARVSYSPCYFINYTVLASPTSPVHGYVSPGRYVFMVTTSTHARHHDTGEFDVPPSGIASDIDLTV